MARREDGRDARATGKRGKGWNIQKGGVRPLHAWTMARALEAAILPAASRVRSFGSGCSFVHRGQYRGRGMAALASRWQLRLGCIPLHLRPHVRGHGAHGWRHRGGSHGVTDPVQDQTRNQKEAHGDARHVYKRTPKSEGGGTCRLAHSANGVTRPSIDRFSHHGSLANREATSVRIRDDPGIL